MLPKMTRMMTCKRFASLASALLLLAPFAAAQTYSITDLGTFLGGTVSQGNGINNLGQVAGYARFKNYNAHGFIWSESTGLTDLGSIPPETNFSSSQAINSFGDVVGYSDYNELLDEHAVLWSHGTIHDLGTLPGGTYSQANGINDSNQIAGFSNSSNASMHAVLWSKTGSIQDLGALVGGYSQGAALNNNAEVVGFSIGAHGNTYGFWWSASAGLQQLPLLNDGGSASANAINNLGETAGGSGNYAVIWHNNKSHSIESLGTISGQTWSAAFGINDSDRVVGWSGYRAFVWSATSGMQDLNTLIPPTSGWQLTAAYAINSTGQITGQGTINGEQHGFLLTPVSK